MRQWGELCLAPFGLILHGHDAPSKAPGWGCRSRARYVSSPKIYCRLPAKAKRPSPRVCSPVWLGLFPDARGNYSLALPVANVLRIPLARRIWTPIGLDLAKQHFSPRGFPRATTTSIRPMPRPLPCNGPADA